MPSQNHKLLIKTLNKLVKQERWQKIPKKRGKVTKVSFTKSGNIKIVIKTPTKIRTPAKARTPAKETTFYVLKKNKNLFQEALIIQKGDSISVALRTQLGKYYCVKLTRKPTGKLTEKLTEKKNKKLKELGKKKREDKKLREWL